LHDEAILRIAVAIRIATKKSGDGIESDIFTSQHVRHSWGISSTRSGSFMALAQNGALVPVGGNFLSLSAEVWANREL
jgi:hypothetical protein